MNPKKSELLVDVVEHIDIKKHNVVPLVEAMSKMAFSARDLARAADIYDAMLREEDCAIILCLAGSLISAGLKNVIVDLVRNNMVDAIVSTGAIIVDQDFFEALGFKHYKGDIFMNDDVLRRLVFTTPTLTKISCGFAIPPVGRLPTRSSPVPILHANSFARWGVI